MALNIAKVEKLIRKDLSNNWPKLAFKIQCDSKKIIASERLSINNLCDDVEVEISVSSGCSAMFIAVFNQIEKTPKILDLINEYNEYGFFKAYINCKGYLEVQHAFICLEEDMFKAYSSEFLVKLVNLNKNESFCKIISYTY